MESARTPEEQTKIDEGQLVLDGLSFSMDNGIQLRRRTDQPELFDKFGDVTLSTDPQKRAEEFERMRGAGVRGV